VRCQSVTASAACGGACGRQSKWRGASCREGIISFGTPPPDVIKFVRRFRTVSARSFPFSNDSHSRRPTAWIAWEAPTTRGANFMSSRRPSRRKLPARARQPAALLTVEGL